MTKKNQSNAATESQLKENEKKWSKTLIAAGWTVMPNVIIERQRALGLDALDVNIILHLASRWWKADGKPHPSKGSIAEAMNVHPRTVQKRIAAMEAAKLIRREERRLKGGGSKTNIYHLDGLIKEAMPYAEEKIAERKLNEERRKAKAAKRGRPNLKVISGGADE